MSTTLRFKISEKCPLGFNGHQFAKQAKRRLGLAFTHTLRGSYDAVACVFSAAPASADEPARDEMTLRCDVDLTAEQLATLDDILAKLKPCPKRNNARATALELDDLDDATDRPLGTIIYCPDVDALIYRAPLEWRRVDTNEKVADA